MAQVTYLWVDKTCFFKVILFLHYFRLMTLLAPSGIIKAAHKYSGSLFWDLR